MRAGGPSGNVCFLPARAWASEHVELCFGEYQRADALRLTVVDTAWNFHAGFARRTVFGAVATRVLFWAADHLVVRQVFSPTFVDALRALVVVQAECVDVAFFKTHLTLRLERTSENGRHDVLAFSGDTLDVERSVDHLIPLGKDWGVLLITGCDYGEYYSIFWYKKQ